MAALGFAVGGVGVASAVPVASRHADMASKAVDVTRVGDSAESWYSTPAGGLCLPLVGCLPVPLSLPLYPAGTLHVGVTLGAASARTYVVPAVPKLGNGRVPVEGLLYLPVDTSPLSGTLDVGSARITACLTTGRPPRQGVAEGMTAGNPPSVDCKVSVPARYDAAYGEFRVDLGRFLARWQHGTPNRGVALVPDTAGGSPVANWQVAFAGKGSSGPTVHSLLSYAARVVRPPSATPTASTGTPAGASVPPSVTVPPPGAVAVTPQSSPPAIAAPAQTAVYLIRSKDFRYPAIFVAPLAVLAGVIFFGRLFTGSTTRPRTRPKMGADSSDG